MGKITLVLLIVIGLIAISESQSITKQATLAREKCEQGLRNKGCKGITSSCDINYQSFTCKCKASTCPRRSKRSIFTKAQKNKIKARQAFKTSGCNFRGGCPSGWCCGPAHIGSKLNMKMCYPPGSPC